MQYKDAIVKVLLPWWDEEGDRQHALLRFDARGTSVDLRRIRREVRKWYKAFTGRSVRTSLLKNPRFVLIFPQYGVDDTEVTAADKEAEAIQQREWLMKLHMEDEENAESA